MRRGTIPELVLSEETIQAAAARNDAAVITISRLAGEGRDRTLAPGDYYLSDPEHALLRMVRKHFSTVIVLLNVCGTIDMEWVDIYHPDGVLMVWIPGQEGASAAADHSSGPCQPLRSSDRHHRKVLAGYSLLRKLWSLVRRLRELHRRRKSNSLLGRCGQSRHGTHWGNGGPAFGQPPVHRVPGGSVCGLPLLYLLRRTGTVSLWLWPELHNLYAAGLRVCSDDTGRGIFCDCAEYRRRCRKGRRADLSAPEQKVPWNGPTGNWWLSKKLHCWLRGRSRS